jgi:glycolate oxidase iron-sulfur subunit
MGWITPHHPTAAETDACVSCGLCLPACPTYRLTGEETASPRGRLAAMAAVADGVVPLDSTFEDIMSFCLGCRACEAVCPSLVPYGRAIEGTRAEIAAQRPQRSRRVRHWLFTRVLGSSSIMRVVTIGAAVGQRVGLDKIRRGPMSRLRGLRPLPLWPRAARRRPPPPPDRRGTVALLTGCVMAPWFGDVQQATIETLEHAGYEVVVPSGQTCCGALAAHDGAADGARSLAAANVAAFAFADLIVTDSAGCGAHLKEYGHWADEGDAIAAKTVDVNEFVASLVEDGSLPTFPDNGVMVAIQDPCHLRHAQRIVAEPRALVRAAGYVPMEIDDLGLCCGAAGSYTLLEPEASNELGQRKAQQVRASGALIVASANPGCEIQLRAHLGGRYVVRHPVELYRDALTVPSRAPRSA